MCQQHLVAALRARIRSTEQAIGQRFAFEVVQLDHATAFFAHRWPHASHHLPFHRIFHYRAPASAPRDALLDRLVDEHIDAVIEVVPGAHQAATARILQAYGFEPVWQIPWLHLPLEEVTSAISSSGRIEKVAPPELAQLAVVLSTAYGYEGAEQDAWQAFAQYGYRAAGFVCFWPPWSSTPPQQASSTSIIPPRWWMARRHCPAIAGAVCKRHYWLRVCGMPSSRARHMHSAAAREQARLARQTYRRSRCGC